MAAGINVNSLTGLNQVKASCRERYFQKALNSLRSLKVKFGNNFIDQLTPFVAMNFCIGQTVSLFLIGNTKIK